MVPWARPGARLQLQPPGWAGALAAAAVVAGAAGAGPAHAFGVPFGIEDISYTIGKCPAGTFTPESNLKVGRDPAALKSSCLFVEAQAVGNAKAVEAASVFGFVENNEGASVLTVNPDGTTRTGIANVLETIPKGGGPVKFTLVVFDGRIAADKLPLQFKGFSAQPSPKNIEERFAPLSDCELGIAEDPDAC